MCSTYLSAAHSCLWSTLAAQVLPCKFAGLRHPPSLGLLPILSPDYDVLMEFLVGVYLLLHEEAFHFINFCCSLFGVGFVCFGSENGADQAAWLWQALCFPRICGQGICRLANG